MVICCWSKPFHSLVVFQVNRHFIKLFLGTLNLFTKGNGSHKCNPCHPIYKYLVAPLVISSLPHYINIICLVLEWENKHFYFRSHCSTVQYGKIWAFYPRRFHINPRFWWKNLFMHIIIPSAQQEYPECCKHSRKCLMFSTYNFALRLQEFCPYLVNASKLSRLPKFLFVSKYPCR